MNAGWLHLNGHFFLKKKWRTQVLFVGHWYPCLDFWWHLPPWWIPCLSGFSPVVTLRFISLGDRKVVIMAAKPFWATSSSVSLGSNPWPSMTVSFLDGHLFKCPILINILLPVTSLLSLRFLCLKLSLWTNFSFEGRNHKSMMVTSPLSDTLLPLLSVVSCNRRTVVFNYKYWWVCVTEVTIFKR